jgi:hypothetical protein
VASGFEGGDFLEELREYSLLKKKKGSAPEITC